MTRASCAARSTLSCRSGFKNGRSARKNAAVSPLSGRLSCESTGSSEVTTYDILLRDDMDEPVDEIENGGYREIGRGNYTLLTEADYVWVNGERSTIDGEGFPIEVEADQMYQIIVQRGVESPYLIVIKGVD